MMGDFAYAENAGMHNMYERANGNVNDELRMHHAQFSDRRMPDHRIFQQSYSQLRETHSFHVIRHDAGQRRTVRNPSLEESILSVVPHRPESSTRDVAHHISQSVCRALNENRLHMFHFQRVQALNPVDYLLRLPVGGTVRCAAAGLYTSCAEQLL
ncbi:uncharacterized protein TNCV_1931011 [Trichonephila clavipes]|nr:uncharacterized protein TNCV_1931011 [Trichonephila clavipes]